MLLKSSILTSQKAHTALFPSPSFKIFDFNKPSSAYKKRLRRLLEEYAELFSYAEGSSAYKGRLLEQCAQLFSLPLCRAQEKSNTTKVTKRGVRPFSCALRIHDCPPKGDHARAFFSPLILCFFFKHKGDCT